MSVKSTHQLTFSNQNSTGTPVQQFRFPRYYKTHSSQRLRLSVTCVRTSVKESLVYLTTDGGFNASVNSVDVRGVGNAAFCLSSDGAIPACIEVDDLPAAPVTISVEKLTGPIDSGTCRFVVVFQIEVLE